MSVDNSPTNDSSRTPWVGCVLLDNAFAASHNAIPVLFRTLTWVEVPIRPGVREHSALLDNWTALFEAHNRLGDALSAEVDGVRACDLMHSCYKDRTVALGLFTGKCFPEALCSSIKGILQILYRRSNPSGWRQGGSWDKPTFGLLANVTEDWGGLRSELHHRFDGFPSRDEVSRLVGDANECRFNYCPICLESCLKQDMDWDRMHSLALAETPAVSLASVKDARSAPPEASRVEGQSSIQELASVLSAIDQQIMRALTGFPDGLTADQLVRALTMPDADKEPSRGHIVMRCQLLSVRGLVTNPGKGYRLTPIGHRVCEALT